VIGGRQLVVDRDAKNADAADPLDAWAWSGQVSSLSALASTSDDHFFCLSTVQLQIILSCPDADLLDFLASRA